MAGFLTGFKSVILDFDGDLMEINCDLMDLTFIVICIDPAF